MKLKVCLMKKVCLISPVYSDQVHLCPESQDYMAWKQLEENISYIKILILNAYHYTPAVKIEVPGKTELDWFVIIIFTLYCKMGDVLSISHTIPLRFCYSCSNVTMVCP